MATASTRDHLAFLFEELDRSAAECVPARNDNTGERFVDWSPLVQGQRENSGNKGDAEIADSDRWWALLQKAAEEDAGCNAAIGSLVGMAIGDAVGAPLEFLSVDSRLPDGKGGRYSDRQRPCVLAELEGGQLCYVKAFNKFGTKFGQWTDDTSMALCLADSLLVHNKYHGGDLRVRWHMWWHHGYCNAFRNDARRKYGRTSVGLGGNVSKSLSEVEKWADGGGNGRSRADDAAHADLVPPVYQSSANDAGNGSIMRLAPVPIAYHLSVVQAVEVAAWQSLASHPGGDAAMCCRFMTFLIVKAIAAHQDVADASPDAGARDPSSDLKAFIEDMIEQFFQDPRNFGDGTASSTDDGAVSLARLQSLLSCQPQSRKEAHWDWKLAELPIAKAIAAREGPRGEDLYNGHPVIPTYFGAYCMDGLAMAMWALWNSESFADSVQRAANLLGDADTVAAITGQLSGAVYGWRGITSNPWSKACLMNLKQWDPCAEVGLRAALLYHYGPPAPAQVRQAEGFPAVRVFELPRPGSNAVAEIPSNELVHVMASSGDFIQVKWKKVDPKADSRRQPQTVVGWIGRKNVTAWGEALGTEDLVSWKSGSHGAPVAPRGR